VSERRTLHGAQTDIAERPSLSRLAAMWRNRVSSVKLAPIHMIDVPPSDLHHARGNPKTASQRMARAMRGAAKSGGPRARRSGSST
jgi:hypothetical protein